MFAFLPFILGNWKAVLVGAGLLAIGGWAIHERSVFINEGEQRELKKIEDSNHDSERKADNGSTTVDLCFSNGGAWDRERGVCDHSVPGR